MPIRHREEVLNVAVAECISERGMVAAPESIITGSGGPRAMPDVIMSFHGLRCVIEGKMGDARNARSQVASDIIDRVESGIAHVAIGIVYPGYLRETPHAELRSAIVGATLEFLVCSEAGNGEWKLYCPHEERHDITDP